jgi:hypothetical protein
MTHEYLLLTEVAYIIARDEATSLRAWRHHSGAARLVVVD